LFAADAGCLSIFSFIAGGWESVSLNRPPRALPGHGELCASQPSVAATTAKDGEPTPQWQGSVGHLPKIDLYGERHRDEDNHALADYVDMTIKALKRSLKAQKNVPGPG
jgi:hypothetical protein